MKKLRYILTLLLLLTLTLSFIACGDEEKCEHKDADDDKLCDECGEAFDDGEESGGGETDGGVTLIEDGEFKFQIVLGNDLKSDALIEIDKLAKLVERSFGCELPIVQDNVTSLADCELLIGTVTSRGDEYKYDKYTLGPTGYIIKPVGNKVMLLAGSDEELLTSLKLFISDILGIEDNELKSETVTFKYSDGIEKIPTSYRISSVTVGGESIKGYKIVVDASQCPSSRATLRDGAKMLQDFFYEQAGIYLNIEVDTDAIADGEAIILRTVAKGEAGQNGFRTRVSGKSYIIECAHYNKFEEAFTTFYNKSLAFSRESELVLKGYSHDKDITTVRYSEFGAVGDGRTDDYRAIYDAHVFANEGGQTVYADAGKTYYLHEIPVAIPIRTDVDWMGCKIIVDDSDVTAKANTNVAGINVIYDNGLFDLQQDSADISLDAESIAAINARKDADGLVLRGLESGEPTNNIGFAPGYPAMLRIFNYDNYNYLRYGYVDSAGGYQRELVLVDKDGNIDPSTPLLHDYTNVSTIIIHRADTEPITLENLVFESIASRVNLHGGYHSIARGININRANVTVKNIEHIIVGELERYQPVRQDENGLSVPAEGYRYSGGKIIDDKGSAYVGNDITAFTGHSYSGLVVVGNTHNTYVKDVTFQSRVLYREGTYDIGAFLTNKLVFEDCVQSNFFEEDGKTVNMYKCWGIAGTNYCKNMEYLNCRLTRYDAHAGVVNGKIVGGELAVLRLIGGGDFLVEGVKIYAYSGTPLQLREDYGASFNGTVTLKDCDIVDPTGKGEVPFTSLFSVPTSYWDMGYETFMPNIIIDNLNIETKKSEIYFTGNSSSNMEYDASHRYPYRPIIHGDPSDPDTAGYKFHYNTAKPDEWVAQNITAEGARFYGCEYTVHKNGTSYVVIVTDTMNRYPYHAPDFIKIINNQDKSYTIAFYDCPFYRSVDITAESGTVKWVAVP